MNDFLTDPIWIALGNPGTQRIYISQQGDWWDLIAFRVYGAQRGTEHLMYRLIEENYPLREIAEFPAGVAVIVPTVAITTDLQLVPWKKASQVIV